MSGREDDPEGRGEDADGLDTGRAWPGEGGRARADRRESGQGERVDGATDPFERTHGHRVRFAETDRQGVAFFGEHATWMDEAVNHFLAARGVDYPDLEAAGVTTSVAAASLEYAEPAAYGERVSHHLRVKERGDTSVVFGYECRREADGAVLATGEVTHVAVAVETGEPVALAEAFGDALGEPGDG